MSDELQSLAEVASPNEDELLYGAADARIDSKASVLELVARNTETLAKITERLTHLVPEHFSVELVTAQGQDEPEGGGGPGGQTQQVVFPDLLLAGNWRLAGIYAFADASASADLTVKITNLWPGITFSAKCVRLNLAPTNVFIPLGKTLPGGSKLDSLGPVTVDVSGGATGDKCVVGFVFEKVAGIPAVGR